MAVAQAERVGVERISRGTAPGPLPLVSLMDQRPWPAAPEAGAGLLEPSSLALLGNIVGVEVQQQLELYRALRGVLAEEAGAFDVAVSSDQLATFLAGCELHVLLAMSRILLDPLRHQQLRQGSFAGRLCSELGAVVSQKFAEQLGCPLSGQLKDLLVTVCANYSREELDRKLGDLRDAFAEIERLGRTGEEKEEIRLLYASSLCSERHEAAPRILERYRLLCTGSGAGQKISDLLDHGLGGGEGMPGPCCMSERLVSLVADWYASLEDRQWTLAEYLAGRSLERSAKGEAVVARVCGRLREVDYREVFGAPANGERCQARLAAAKSALQAVKSPEGFGGLRINVCGLVFSLAGIALGILAAAFLAFGLPWVLLGVGAIGALAAAIWFIAACLATIVAGSIWWGCIKCRS